MKAKTQTKHKGANGFEMALFIPYDSTWTGTPYIHSILASLDYSTHYLVFTEIRMNLRIKTKRHRSFIKARHHLPNSV